MPKFRLLHANYRTGRKSTSLTELELITWLAYQHSADDFGVCLYSVQKIQGDDPWLEHRKARDVERALQRVVASTLVSTFTDGKAYLYQPDWQFWQRIKHPTRTSLPPIPVDLLATECDGHTIALFLANHPRCDILVAGLIAQPGLGLTSVAKIRASFSAKVLERFLQDFPKVAELFSLHGRAQNALATATATASEVLEESRETFSPPPHGRASALIESPLAWHRKHGAVHVTEFCDWMCFPNELCDQFAGRLTGIAYPEARQQVIAWARTVRTTWTAEGRVPAGRMFDWWNDRWTEAHGDGKPAKGAVDTLAGVRAIERRGRS